MLVSVTDAMRFAFTVGATFLAALLGSIVAPFLKSRLDEKLEHRKSLLSRETHLHEKQTEIVAELFAQLRETQRTISDGTGSAIFEGQDQREFRLDFKKRYLKLAGYFWRQELFLPNPLIDVFVPALTCFSKILLLSDFIDSDLAPTPPAQAWTNLQALVFVSLPPLIAVAEAHCRALVRSEP